MYTHLSAPQEIIELDWQLPAYVGHTFTWFVFETSWPPNFVNNNSTHLLHCNVFNVYDIVYEMDFNWMFFFKKRAATRICNVHRQPYAMMYQLCISLFKKVVACPKFMRWCSTPIVLVRFTYIVETSCYSCSYARGDQNVKRPYIAGRFLVYVTKTSMHLDFKF